MAARAQQAERMRRIGLLTPLAADDQEIPARLTALAQGMQELGWTNGRNLRIDYRGSGGGGGRLRTAAKELLELNPEVVVGSTTPVVAALRGVSRTIPIVFVQVAEPVESGFVTSFARPGGNITGFTNFEASLAGKWVELLKEIAPPDYDYVQSRYGTR
jgi:putative ABC transport system substrate-binding protein